MSDGPTVPRRRAFEDSTQPSESIVPAHHGQKSTVTNAPQGTQPTVVHAQPRGSKAGSTQGTEATVIGAFSSDGATKPLETTVKLTVPLEDLSRDAFVANAPRIVHEGNAVPALGGIPLLAKLGQGGMGAVYYGIHPRLESEVAVKVLPFHLAERDPVMIQRFFREAKLAARIRSQHLVGVMDVNEENGLCYLVMEFVRGKSAGRHLKACLHEGQLGLAEAVALEVCLAAAEGLAAAHSEGVIHRDVKPDNIMIPCFRDSDALDFGRAKLADLGLASGENSDGSTLTGTQACMGTPGYMAPEQGMDTKTAGRPADVFSMGATLYAMLAGKAPFSGPTSMQTVLATIQQPHPPLKNFRPDVSPGTLALIERCLNKDASKRFADAAALRDALREGLAGLAKRTAVSRASQPGHAHPTLLAGAGAVSSPQALASAPPALTPVPPPPPPPVAAPRAPAQARAIPPAPRRMTPPPQRQGSMNLVALAGGLALILGAGWMWWNSHGVEADPVTPPVAAASPETPVAPPPANAQPAPAEPDEPAEPAAAPLESKTAAVEAAKDGPAPAAAVAEEPKDSLAGLSAVEQYKRKNDFKWRFKDGQTFLARNMPEKAKIAFEEAIALWPDAPQIEEAKAGLAQAEEQIALLPPKPEPKPEAPKEEPPATAQTQQPPPPQPPQPPQDPNAQPPQGQFPYPPPPPPPPPGHPPPPGPEQGRTGTQQPPDRLPPRQGSGTRKP
ncbi:MAG: protein kinase [Planctomycetota bacterium]|nr:protein kinase [Planctomycetota bacterium]